MKITIEDNDTRENGSYRSPNRDISVTVSDTHVATFDELLELMYRAIKGSGYDISRDYVSEYFRGTFDSGENSD